MPSDTDVSSPPDPETVSLDLPEDTSVDTEDIGTEVGKSKGKFTSDSAREAVQARWAKERARETEEAEARSDGRVVMMRVPVHLGDIVSKLASQAKKGDTHAARELREWMRQFPADDESDLSALDGRTQRAVLTRIIAEVIEEEGSLPDSNEVA